MGGADLQQEIGKEYEKYIEKQKKALAIKCPFCGRKLEAVNLIEVHCQQCKKDFPINELIKLSQAPP